MAFNPFHSFRKHKKVVFATLTIICMFTFVLSSGLGGRMDLFTELPHMIGIGRAREKYAKDKEDKVVKVYGDKVTLENLAELRQERALAISCLMKSIQYAQSELAKEQSKLFEKSLDPTGFQQQQMQYQQKQQLLAAAQIRNLLYFVSENELYQLLFLLQQAPDRVAQAIGQTQPVERLLDFMIWRHQADKLGIYLTDADIENEVRRQTLSNATVEGIHGAIVSEFPKTNVDRVYKVLGDELRVRLAMAAMMGYDAGDLSVFGSRDRNKEVKQVPVAFTPYDFWEFYKDNRTTVEVALLPIRVEDLVKDITETPSDKALKKLYDRGKDRVPDPNSSEAAFKEPQRIRVEYVGARPDSPYYKRVAEAVIAASRVTDPTAFNLYLVSQEKDRRSEFRLPSWTEQPAGLSAYRDVSRPESAAGLVGQTLGADGGLGSVFSVLAGYEAMTTVARQDRARLDMGCTEILAGMNALPWTAAGLMYYTHHKQYQPLETIQKKILEKLQTETARKILEDNLRKLDLALEAVNALPEADRKMAADEAVFNAIQDYGLTVHQVMEQPRDRYTIHEDKALKPLKDAHDADSPLTRSEEDKKTQFAEQLFPDPRQGVARLYSAQRIPSPTSLRDKPGDYFLHWRIEDKPAEVRSYRDAEADVKKAWLMDRAREEADKQAKKLAEEVRGKTISELRDYSLNQKRDLIEPNVLGRIARKMPAPSLRADAGRLYEPYKFPEKVAHPNATFVDKLLGLKEKGDTVVLRDNPKKVYYVAVLTERDPPTVAEFYEIYKNGVPPLLASTKQDPLLDEFVMERRRKYVENFIRQLRIDSGAGNDKGYYEISKETKERIEGRAGGEPGDEG